PTGPSTVSPLQLAVPTPHTRRRRHLYPPRPDQLFTRRMLAIVGTIAGLILVVAGLVYGSTAVLLIYVSALCAIGLLPFIRWLEWRGAPGQRRLPRWLALTIVFGLFLTLVAVLAAVVLPPLVAQAGEL